jgi:hypothetical protein
MPTAVERMESLEERITAAEHAENCNDWAVAANLWSEIFSTIDIGTNPIT